MSSRKRNRKKRSRKDDESTSSDEWKKKKKRKKKKKKKERTVKDLVNAILSSKYRRARRIVRDDKTIANQSMEDGYTPLIYAVLNRSEEMCLLLLRHGADINKTDMDGTTPLLHAVLLENGSIAQLLETKGADTMLKDYMGNSPHDFGLIDLLRRQNVREASRSTDREKEGLREFARALKMKRIEKEREEHEWREKLRMESDAFQQSQFETMWHGTERVRQDYEKIFGKSSTSKESNKKNKQESSKKREYGASSKADSKFSSLSIAQRREKYLKLWKTFESLRTSGKQFSENEVPWPLGSDMNLFCFPSSSFMDVSARRKLIRQEYLRWHPDKFKQKFEKNFRGDTHTFQDRLLKRVIGIAQKLSDMKSQMLRCST